MQIAIVGAGFAGLACAWTLLHSKMLNQKIQVTIFDQEGIGAGASGVAVGLMHPFANTHSKLNREGYEGFRASMQLLNAAEQALGHRPFEPSGILRPALSPAQEHEYREASQKHPDDIVWKEAKEMESMVPHIIKAPGIWIKTGITVYTDEYLKGLWLACQNLCAIFQKHEVKTLEELKNFDLILITMGAKCSSINELSQLPLRYTKGQILELIWPEGLPPLTTALNGNVYCVMMRDQKRCLVGTTYERGFSTPEADIETAKDLILPKLAELYAPLEGAKIINCRAGVRVSTPQHLPLIKKINSRCFTMTGFGSKGLLYHALYSQKLLAQIHASF